MRGLQESSSLLLDQMMHLERTEKLWCPRTYLPVSFPMSSSPQQGPLPAALGRFLPAQ